MEPVISLSTFGMIPPHQVLEHIAKLGFKRIEFPMEQHRGPWFAPELWPETPHYRVVGRSADALPVAMERLKMSTVGVSGHCDLAQDGAVERLKTRVRLAKRWGAQYVSTGIGAGWQAPQKHRPQVLENLKAAVDLAERLDIILALRSDRWLTDEPEKALKLLGEVGSPNLRLAIEVPGATAPPEGDFARQLRAALSLVTVLYLTACPQCAKERFSALGLGDLGAMLKEAGFDQHVCISLGRATQMTPDPQVLPLRIGPFPLDPSHLEPVTTHVNHAAEWVRRGL